MGCSESNTKNDVGKSQPNQAENAQNQPNHAKHQENQVQANAPFQVYMVVGGPGSGKGTQCGRLAKELGFVHLSTGDLLREEKNSGSELADEINQLMNDGKLVSTPILIKLLLNAMEKCGRDKNFLIDGFPRNFENIEMWKEQVNDKNLAELKMVLYFELEEEVMLERLLERAKSSGRQDDNEETIRKRFTTFKEESIPVIEMIAEKHADIFKRINSNQAIDDVFQEVRALFA